MRPSFKNSHPSAIILHAVVMVDAPPAIFRLVRALEVAGASTSYAVCVGEASATVFSFLFFTVIADPILPAAVARCAVGVPVTRVAHVARRFISKRDRLIIDQMVGHERKYYGIDARVSRNAHAGR